MSIKPNQIYTQVVNHHTGMKSHQAFYKDKLVYEITTYDHVEENLLKQMAIDFLKFKSIEDKNESNR